MAGGGGKGGMCGQSEVRREMIQKGLRFHLQIIEVCSPVQAASLGPKRTLYASMRTQTLYASKNALHSRCTTRGAGACVSLNCPLIVRVPCKVNW